MDEYDIWRVIYIFLDLKNEEAIQKNARKHLWVNIGIYIIA